MFMFDVETLGIESTSVVLSAAVIHFDINEEFTYQDLIDSAVFVKFSAKDQIKNYKRTQTKSTLDWWNNQGQVAKKRSLIPSSQDLEVIEGIEILREYIDSFDKSRNKTVWSRGSLDQCVIDSLSRTAELPDLFPYYRWRDVRTALDLVKDSTLNGYCSINLAGFDVDRDVVKHDPVHDCALDIMMLRYGV